MTEAFCLFARCSDLSFVYKTTTQIHPNTISSIQINFRNFIFLGRGGRLDFCLFERPPRANVRKGIGRYEYSNREKND